MSTLSTPTTSTVSPPDLGLKKRPWRLHLTPFSSYLTHASYSGKGTEDMPYIIDWLPDDAENPMTWSQARKWTVTAMVAIATMAVALASSTL
jgi:hypothetical protein